jgi:hypothetical protein
MNIRTTALLGGLAFLATSVAGVTAVTTPAGVVGSFYQWYFSANVKGRAFNHLSGARKFLTPSLYALLSRVQPYEARHGEVLDADPFIDAQIDAVDMILGNAIVTGTNAVLPVTIRYSKAPSAGHVKVVVVMSSTGWRIDDFVGTTGGSLRKTLAHNMK